jgi:hypothetical protein
MKYLSGYRPWGEAAWDRKSRKALIRTPSSEHVGSRGPNRSPPRALIDHRAAQKKQSGAVVIALPARLPPTIRMNGRLMKLRFAQTESALDYFTATLSYLRHHGKPVAFYSDKHSIFRVPHEGTTGVNKGVTQFGRALAELNIDIICANTPQAKGRVERMNQILQDGLVKELRLAGVSTMADGNAFAPKFMEDFNRRFARIPHNPHDAHRPVGDQDLDQIFSWHEERTMSRNLVVHFKRVSYLIEPTPETLGFGRRKVIVHEWENGRVEIHCGGLKLPYSALDQHPHVDPGEVVENKRLGAVLATIQLVQAQRDVVRLASPKMTIRQKDRLQASRPVSTSTAAPVSTAQTVKRRGRPPKHTSRVVLAGVDPHGPVQAFLDRFAVEQAERRRASSVKANDRKREREFVAAQAPHRCCWQACFLERREDSPLLTRRLGPARPLSSRAPGDCHSSWRAPPTGLGAWT